MLSLAVNEETREDTLILRTEGRLVIGQVEPLQARLNQVWQGQTGRVIIDLAGCKFIDSSGIALLVTSFKHAREAGKRFVLVNTGPQVKNVLELTRLDKAFDIRESVEAALVG